jgi:hypothetical protein
LPSITKRWELELEYDEIKTELLDREEAIRSKTRRRRAGALGDPARLQPRARGDVSRGEGGRGRADAHRLRRVASLDLRCDEWRWLSVSKSPGAIPKRLAAMRANLKRYILSSVPEQARLSTRAVKIKMSNYARKRSRGRGEEDENGEGEVGRRREAGGPDAQRGR